MKIMDWVYSRFEKGNSRNVNKNGFVFYDYPYVIMKLWD